jgi:hypothetical protein
MEVRGRKSNKKGFSFFFLDAIRTGI